MRIAAAQARQAWGRPDEGAERVIEWIGRAAGERVDLLAFGETHLGGYPFWIGDTGGARFAQTRNEFGTDILYILFRLLTENRNPCSDRAAAIIGIIDT